MSNVDNSTEVVPSVFWINLDKLDDAKCIHAIAVDNEPREFKGVKAIVATSTNEAANELLYALQLVATAMNKYTAPIEIVRVVSDALKAAKGTDA